MEGAMFKDDEIKRVIEGAAAKFQANADLIGQALQGLGPEKFIQMPNPLPDVAKDLINTTTELGKIRDEYARSLKAVEQLRDERTQLRDEAAQEKDEAAQLKAKYKGKVNSLKAREDDLQVHWQDFHEQRRAQETLSRSTEIRSKRLESRIKEHGDDVEAHARLVGKYNAEADALEKREARVEAQASDITRREHDLEKSQLAMDASDRRVQVSLSLANRALGERSKDLDKRAIAQDGRDEAARALDGGIRKLVMDKVQHFADAMREIHPAVMALSREVPNLQRARNIAVSVTNDMEDIQARTTNLDQDTASIMEAMDNVSRNIYHMGPSVDESFGLFREVMAELEVVQPQVQRLIDSSMRRVFEIVEESTRPAPTSSAAVGPQTAVGLPSQKRKLGFAQSGSNKRHTSSQGQASHPDNVDAETEEPLEGIGSSSVVETEAQTQTQEATAGPAEDGTNLQMPVVAPAQGVLAAPQQSAATSAPGSVDNIWSMLLFSAVWTAEDQETFRDNIRHYQNGAQAYRPLKVFEKIVERSGEELCWISQSMKSKGNFATHGNDRACVACTKYHRLCLRIGRAPPQSGKSYLITRRP